MYKLVTSHASIGVPVSPSRGGAQAAVPLVKGSAVFDQARWMESAGRVEPRVREWLSNQQLDFDRHVYVLVVPLGADEAWEETVNGDAFLRADLAPEHSDWGHKTFEQFAHAYLNHRNTDPAKGFGDVPFVCYSPEMDRVEGIWRLDKQRARDVGALDVVTRIEREGSAEVSMGCRVKNDVCSLCGNEAKTLRDYCSHTRTPGFGAIDPATGRKMRVFNPKPVFFDLSDVRVPAAPEALVMGALSPEFAEILRSMAKTSSAGHVVVPSAFLAAERWGVTNAGLHVPTRSKASSACGPVKLSDLVKEAPALESHVISPMQAAEDEITEDVLKTAGVANMPLPTVLSSLAALGIVLSPRELASVRRCCTGCEAREPSQAEIQRVWATAPVSTDLKAGYFSPAVAHAFRGMVPDRSVLYPHLGRRIAAEPERAARVRAEISVRVPDDMAEFVASYIKAMALRLGELLAGVRATYGGFESHHLGVGYLTPGPGIEKAAGDGALSAAAILPSAYILARAGMASDGTWLTKSAHALHVPGVEHLFGGLMSSASLLSATGRT